MLCNSALIIVRAPWRNTEIDTNLRGEKTMTTIIPAILKSRIGRTISVATSGVLFIGALALGLASGGSRALRMNTADAAETKRLAVNQPPLYFRCSNVTIAGKYAQRSDGFVPNGPPPTPMVPFATVSLMTLDADGTLTNDVTVSRNGVILSSVDHGTYTVNEDCKGKMTINIATAPFQLNFDLVVAEGGKEFYTIATTPSVVTANARRVE
jgi:hypothetical protein